MRRMRLMVGKWAPQYISEQVRIYYIAFVSFLALNSQFWYVMPFFLGVLDLL